MSDKLTLRQKLGKIQLELKAPKNQRNNFGNYNYRSCEDILEALKPLMDKNGVVLVLSDEVVQVGDRYYVRAEARIRDIDSEAELFTCAMAREEESKKGMDGSQITGASSSYARKYALNGLFAIDDTKDSDFTNKHDSPALTKTESRSSKVTCKECGADTEYKSGTNKNGKKWGGYFCTANKDHSPRWVSVKQDLQPEIKDVIQEAEIGDGVGVTDLPF